MSIKIAYVTTVASSLRYLFLDQMLYLKKKGYEVVGVSSYGSDVEYIVEKGIKHISVPITRKSFDPILDLRSLFCLYQIFKRENFSIIHTHMVKSGIYGRWAAKLVGTPIIIHTIHGFIFHEGSSWLWRLIFSSMEKVASYCSDFVFSVNSEDITTMLKMKICPPGKIDLLGQGGIGINLSKFNPSKFEDSFIKNKREELGIPRDAFVVGFAGRLVKEKGVVELLEAAKELYKIDKNFLFLFIGPIDYDKPDFVEPSLAKEYGISNVCYFTGQCYNMPEMYQIMDLFVLPSYREGLPLVILEASAMGKPVIATNIRGCREAVNDGINGVLFPKGNVEKLYYEILQLKNDPSKMKRMGDEGKRIALERFDQSDVFKKVEGKYAELLRKKGLL